MPEDENIAPEAGQGNEIIAPEITGQAEPFYSARGVDGKDVVFNTRDELDKHMRDSFMMQSTFTKKSQAHAQSVKEWEAQKAKDQEELAAKKKELEAFDNLYKTRPDIRGYIQKAIKGPMDSKGQSTLVQESIKQALTPITERLDKFDNYIQSSQQTTAREKAIKELAEELPDFDKETVMGAMSAIDPNDPKSLMRLFHFASKGQLDPVEAKRREAELRTKKKQGTLLPKGSPEAPGPQKAMSIEELRRRAHEDLGE
jgi:uncharacterized membrane-anchored protein